MIIAKCSRSRDIGVAKPDSMLGHLCTLISFKVYHHFFLIKCASPPREVTVVKTAPAQGGAERSVTVLGLFQFRRFVSDCCSAQAVRLSYGARTVICFHTNSTVRQQSCRRAFSLSTPHCCRTVRLIERALTG